MHVYSRFWSWLTNRQAGLGSQPPHPHSAKLSLRKLEDRQVLSVSAVLVGLDVTFTGDDGGVSADSLVFTIDANGNLQHNLGGTNGFQSDIDLDNQLAGEQTLAVSDLTSLNLFLGDDADAVEFAADFDFSSGSLHVVAESITAAGGSLSVHGLTTLDAGSANDIVLSGANDFHTIGIVSAHHVTLHDTTGIVLEGLSHVSGDLHLTSIGAIGNEPASELVVEGNAHFSGTSVDLGNALNDHLEFGSISFSSIGTVDISADSSLTIGAASTAGQLTLVSVDDVIFNATIDVTGDTSVSAGTTTGGIEVHAKLTSGGSLLLDAADEIAIDAEIDPTTVTLNADDDITISAAVTATDLITVSAGQDGSGSVILNGTGSLTVDNAGNTADIVLSTGATTGNVTLIGTMTADDSVTITSSGAINGAGLVTALAIDLNAATGIGQTTALELSGTTISADSTSGNIELHNTSAAALSSFQVVAGNGNVTVLNSKALTIEGTVHGNLTATAVTGNLTDSALLTITGTSQFTTSQNNADINLGTLAATGAVTLSTAGTSGNVTIVNTTALALQGNVRGSLIATAITGNLTDSDALTIRADSSFRTNQANADIELGTLTAGGVVTLTTFGTTGNATLVNSTALAIRGTIRGNLDATATTDNLRDSGTLRVTGASRFTTSQADADIELGTLAATGPVTLSTVGTSGDASVVNANGLALQGTVNGNLDATATTGSLTDSDLLTVTGSSHFTTSQSDADIELGTLTATGPVTLSTFGTSGDASVVNATALALQGTVNGNLDATATTGNLTDSDLLTVTGSSNFTTSQSDADIDLGTLAATGPVTLSTAGTTGDATVVNATALALQGTVNGNLAATATTGNLTDSGNITVTGTSHFTTPNDVILDNSANDFVGAITVDGSNVELTDSNQLLLGQVNATNLAVTAGGHITIGTGGGEDLSVTSTVTLNSISGGVSEAMGSNVLADQLLLLGTGTFALNEANAVATLAADVDGAISYVDVDSLVIGTVGTTSGLTTVNSDVKLIIQGDLTIGEVGDLGVNDITIGTGHLTLVVTGSIVETTGNTISAEGLQLLCGTGAVLLNEANAVTTLAADRAGTISYRDVDGLTVGTVTDTASGTTTSGLTNDADVKLVTGGNLLLDQATNLGNQDLYLDVAGTVTQSVAGTIHASGLAIVSTGGATLDQANDVDTLATNTAGSLVVYDIDDLEIGTVTVNASLIPMMLSGIVTSDDDVSITTSTGDLTLTQTINAGAGDVSLAATTGSIVDGHDGQTQITAGDLSLIAKTNIGDITDFSAGTGNAIDVALSGRLLRASISDAGGEIFLNSIGHLTAATGSVNVGGANAATAILRATGGNVDVGTAAGVFSLSSGDNLGLEAIRVGAIGGVLTLPDAGLDVGTGDLRLRGDHDVRDAAGRELGPLVADDLSFASGASGGDTILNTSINTLTAQVTGSGAALTVNEDNGLTLTDIDTSDGNLTVNASQAAAGDITVIDINAGAARVTLATTGHGGGQIIDGDSPDSSTTADITAGEIDLRAGTGIANSTKLEVATASFAATTIRGDINVRDVSGDLAIASLAGGTNGVSITSGVAGDDICVTTVGALTVHANVSNSGTGDRAILLAADGTTTNNDLAILANVTTTGGNSRITLLAGETVSFGGTTATSASGMGEVQVRAGRAFNNGAAESAGSAGGDIVMSDGTVIQSDNGNITLSAPDQVQLSVVNANVGGATGDIFITADADGSGSGAITDILSGEAPNLIGDVATLSAATGIGSAGGNADLDTAINTLVATNTTSGGIFFQEADTLVVGGTGVQTLLGNGGIQIAVDAGSLTVSSAVTAHGAGSVTLHAAAAAVVLNTGVSSTTGAIAISGDSVTQGANIATGGTGTVDVTADQGSITMQDGTATTSTSGQIRYLATGDVALSQLDSTSGPLLVTADSDASGSGAITDNTTGESSHLTTSGMATLKAATGIGQFDDIDTSIGTLAATNTTSGHIAIHETNGLAIAGTGVQTLAGAGNILVNVDAGDLIVNSAVTAQGDGNLTLNAEAGAVRLSAAVSSTTGDLSLTGDSVVQNAGGNLTTGTVLLNTGQIAVAADNGSITMADGTSATTHTGSITYSATGDVALSLLTSTSGDLRVTAGSGATTVGAITDNTAGEAPHLVTTGTATLTAETGIGSGGGTADIETSVAVLRIMNSTSGHIDLTETDAVRIAQLTQAGGGNASVRTLGGTITVDNADMATNAITVSDGGSLLLDANGGAASIIVNDGIQAVGGSITLQADRDVIAHSAPITSIVGNGNIRIVAGHDIQILDPGRQNPVDISVAGSGNISLVAANRLVLGSDDPGIVSNTIQHTTANDVLIQTGTGSITNTLPLLFDIQSPQLTALGEAVLSVTIGRPGESNLAIRIFWGDGTVQTITGLAPGTYTYSHFYTANPNPLDPSAPILINVQAAHDPHLVLRATNVNTPVGSVLNSGVNVPPPVPAQNINADLSAAIYNSAAPGFAQLQSNIASSPGNEANPGQVIFQDTAILATTVPVAGDGLATAVFDTTPPVTYLTFPEPPKAIDTQPPGGVQLSEGALGLNETARTEESLIEERAVILEVLSPDGTVLQRVTLPETALDDMHEVIGKLPDGGYRFLLKEPGEDRLRLLLEFDVRQGKIADETDGSDRPPSAVPKTPDPSDKTTQDDSTKPGAVIDTVGGADLEGMPLSILSGPGGPDYEPTDRHDAVDTAWSGWSTVAARLAWKRAGQSPTLEGAHSAETFAPSDSLTETTVRDSSSVEDSEGGHLIMSLGLLGAFVGITATVGDIRRTSPAPAKLSRASQLFRRSQNAEPGRGGPSSLLGGDVL